MKKQNFTIKQVLIDGGGREISKSEVSQVITDESELICRSHWGRLRRWLQLIQLADPDYGLLLTD